MNGHPGSRRPVEGPLLAIYRNGLEEERGVRGAPECHKINLSRAGFHSITEKLAEA